MWGELYEICWRDIDGVPLIHIARDETFLFPHILGITPEKLLALSRRLQDEGCRGVFSQVPEEFVLKYPLLENFFTISQNSNFSDYIHSTERLALLNGRKLRKKRNLIAQFETLNPNYTVSPISANFFNDCLRLTDDGLEAAVTGKNEEVDAIKRAFDLFDDLPLEGVVIHIADKVVAFSIFSPHIDSTYVVHFEKNDRTYKGSAQMINLKTAEYLSDKCEFINREQDLGLAGLKKAKLSYDPDTILLNYELMPR